MNEATVDVLNESIEAEQDSSSRETVRAFVNNVQNRVQERVGNIAGKEMQVVRGWLEEKLRLLDPTYEIYDTASKGAAAWFEPGTGRMVFDDRTMDRRADTGYWSRVRRHEEVHKNDQAHTFNRGAITFDGKVVPVHPVLIEWHAIRQSGQPDGDLTAGYRAHVRLGDELVAIAGRGAVTDALRTGDIAGLQETINGKDDSFLQESRILPASGHLL